MSVFKIRGFFLTAGIGQVFITLPFHVFFFLVFLWIANKTIIQNASCCSGAVSALCQMLCLLRKAIKSLKHNAIDKQVSNIQKPNARYTGMAPNVVTIMMIMAVGILFPKNASTFLEKPCKASLSDPYMRHLIWPLLRIVCILRPCSFIYLAMAISSTTLFLKSL